MKTTETFLDVVYKAKYPLSMNTTEKGIELTVECKRPAYRVTQTLHHQDVPKDVARREMYLAYELKQMLLKLEDMVQQSFKSN